MPYLNYSSLLDPSFKLRGNKILFEENHDALEWRRLGRHVAKFDTHQELLKWADTVGINFRTLVATNGEEMVAPHSDVDEDGETYYFS